MANLFSAAVTVNIAEVIVESKELIIEKLKENGCRITKQRLVLIDIILEMNVRAARKFIIKLPRSTIRLAWRRYTEW